MCEMQLQTCISMKVDNCIVSVLYLNIHCVSSSSNSLGDYEVNNLDNNQSSVAFFPKLGDHWITKVHLDVEFLEF